MNTMTLPPSSQKPHPLIAPLDVSKITNEKGVKALIKRLLDFHGWFHWPAAAGEFSAPGVHDRMAIKDGVFLSIEAKFGYNKAKETQKQFAAHIIANSGYAFCVNEKNIDHFAMWLESFQHMVKAQMQGIEAPADHGSRCLNAMSALTEMW